MSPTSRAKTGYFDTIQIFLSDDADEFLHISIRISSVQKLNAVDNFIIFDDVAIIARPGREDAGLLRDAKQFA